MLTNVIMNLWTFHIFFPSLENIRNNFTSTAMKKIAVRLYLSLLPAVGASLFKKIHQELRKKIKNKLKILQVTKLQEACQCNSEMCSGKLASQTKVQVFVIDALCGASSHLLLSATCRPSAKTLLPALSPFDLLFVGAFLWWHVIKISFVGPWPVPAAACLLCALWEGVSCRWRRSAGLPFYFVRFTSSVTIYS